MITCLREVLKYYATGTDICGNFLEAEPGQIWRTPEIENGYMQFGHFKIPADVFSDGIDPKDVKLPIWRYENNDSN